MASFSMQTMPLLNGPTHFEDPKLVLGNHAPQEVIDNYQEAELYQGGRPILSPINVSSVSSL